ncbi:MAG: hypothetical protein KA383_13505 [Phycisphaerae bacterium]|nr:hypothetical protein [Phycisphaerae bacterium]
MPEKLLSVGAIARALAVPVHRVKYLIQSRRIQPAGRVGNAWAYPVEVLSRIRTLLEHGGSGRERDL